LSAIANITVYDGAATPVAHTLVAESVTREKGEVIATWREQLASVPKYAQVCAVAKLQRLKSGVYRADVRVEVPVMETVTNQNAAGYTAAPKVAYVNTMACQGFFHERSDVTGRRLVRQILTNLLGNVSTSVTPVSTGPLPELIDQLVSAT
jgi:hypothetical protein